MSCKFGAIFRSNNEIHAEEKWTELDIWMSCENNCGKGYGPDAIETICHYLGHRFGVQRCIVQLSRRNSRAIYAFEKSGFRIQNISRDEQEKHYSPLDYFDSVLMVREIRQNVKKTLEPASETPLGSV